MKIGNSFFTKLRQNLNVCEFCPLTKFLLNLFDISNTFHDCI